LPIGGFEPAAVRRRDMLGTPEELLLVQRKVQAELVRAVPGREMQGLERFAFYAAVRETIQATGTTRGRAPA